MRKAAVVLFGLSLALGAVVSAQNVSMPDYSAWEKTADHTEHYLYKGAKIELRDTHHESNTPDDRHLTVGVFYHPETGKPWFGLYNISPIGRSSDLYLFDANEEGNWVFVRDITDLTEEESDELFRSRYGLVYAGRQ